MSIFRMNNLVRFCLNCSAIRLRNFKNRVSIFPTSIYFPPKRYQSSSTQDVSNSIDSSEDFDYEDESPYSNIDFEAITNGDADKLKAIKVLQLEVDLLRQQGEQVPIRISTERWKNLLALPIQQRVGYLHHLWLNELKTSSAKEKAKEKHKSFLEFKAKLEKAGPKNLTTSSPCAYHLNGTTLVHRIYDCIINRFYNYKLLQAEWFGPKILVDCSYEPFMNLKNLSNCVKQMVIMWADNRDNSNPFDIIFCNVDKESVLWQKMHVRIPQIHDDDGPIHFTSEHYLNLFPKEQLVYLTPYATEMMEKFDPNAIYIIGAYVDVGCHEPVSLAKAKKDGLRMAKLPLDKYLRWCCGQKSLTINQVLSILNDMKDGQSWKQAFRHVPKRKISASSVEEIEEADKPNPLSAKSISENYRKNLVYDLLLKDSYNRYTNKS